MALVPIRKSAVPAYLRNSDFYLALNDEVGEIFIPQNCFKPNMIVKNSNDLALLLSTLRFWGVSTIPLPVITYTLWHKPVEVIDTLLEFEEELRYLRFLRALCAGADLCSGQGKDSTTAWIKFTLDQRTRDYTTLERAAQLCMFQYEYHGGKVWNATTCKLAAGLHDGAAVLHFLHEHGCPWDASCCIKAAETGNLSSLQYAHEHECPWDIRTCIAAAEKHHIECLQYAHEHGCPWDARAYEVAEYNGACYQYMKEKGCPEGEGSINASAKAGDLERVKALHAKGCAWSPRSYEAAVSGHELEVLQYLHQQGCSWDWNICNVAIAYGARPCLRYLLESGAVVGEKELENALIFSYGAEDFRCLLDSKGCERRKACAVAAEYDSLEALQYAVERGCELTADVVKYAALGNSLDCLQYAYEKGLPWAADTCTRIAKAEKKWSRHLFRSFGLTEEEQRVSSQAAKLACLRYAHENGSAWDETTCTAAAKSGDLACLQYLHTHGCPWDEATCIGAAQSGDLTCLQYAHEHGCPWGAVAALAAVQSGSLSCLQYLHERGCDWPWWWFTDIVKNPRNRKCLEYAAERTERHPIVEITAPTTCTGCGYVPPAVQATKSICDAASVGGKVTDEADAEATWQVVGCRGRAVKSKLPSSPIHKTASVLSHQPRRAEDGAFLEPGEGIGGTIMPTPTVAVTTTALAMSKDPPQDTAAPSMQRDGGPWTLVTTSRRKRRKPARL